MFNDYDNESVCQVAWTICQSQARNTHQFNCHTHARRHPIRPGDSDSSLSVICLKSELICVASPCDTVKLDPNGAPIKYSGAIGTTTICCPASCQPLLPPISSLRSAFQPSPLLCLSPIPGSRFSALQYLAFV
eukprot:758444-Hanusia_phi.AAC.3